MILRDIDVKELGEKLIKPYNGDRMGAVAYDLETEAIADNPGQENTQASLKPGESVFIKTKEEITLPNDVIGRVHLRNSKIRQGLMLDAPVYYPGHNTKVFFRITNISQSIIDIYEGELLASIIFEKLSGDVEQPYDGEFQREFKYKGMGRYSAEYEANITHLDDKIDEIKNTERRMYTNVLAIMAIFVGIFSLININIQNVSIDTKNLLTLDFATVGSIAFLIAAIALHTGKNRIFLWIACIAAFAVSILVQAL